MKKKISTSILIDVLFFCQNSLCFFYNRTSFFQFMLNEEWVKLIELTCLNIYLNFQIKLIRLNFIQTCQF